MSQVKISNQTNQRERKRDREGERADNNQKCQMPYVSPLFLHPVFGNVFSVKHMILLYFRKLDFPNKSILFIVNLYFDPFSFLFSVFVVVAIVLFSIFSFIIIIVRNMQHATCDDTLICLYVKMYRK